MELEKRVYDADQAKLVLENPAFSAAFEEIKTEIIESWKKAPARDKDGREHLWQLLKLAEKLESTLRRSLEDGKMARAELQHQQSLKARAKAALGMS